MIFLRSDFVCILIFWVHFFSCMFSPFLLQHIVLLFSRKGQQPDHTSLGLKAISDTSVGSEV